MIRGGLNTVPTAEITGITINGTVLSQDSPGNMINIDNEAEIIITQTGSSWEPWMLMFQIGNEVKSLGEIAYLAEYSAAEAKWIWKYSLTGKVTVKYWRWITDKEIPVKELDLSWFSLETIDNMREQILADTLNTTTAFSINNAAQIEDPYYVALALNSGLVNPQEMLLSQQGLGIKTYQSDLLNNWLNTEWLDGPTGVNSITAIDTSSGSFNIDTLNLSKKVYDMLNRIAVSGGTYDDWLDAVYMNDRITRCESPMYHGGLIKELIFQEVVSNSESQGENGTQPLGTLAGRGKLSGKHKGGKIMIRVDEPSYIMGIISLTPRVDYSQGNKWDTHLQTMDDFHKPQLDQIGFQELITEQMAWFGTKYDDVNSKWVQHSAGKQPAWLNYMTNVNQVRGNFAIRDNEMFMVLNRDYEYGVSTGIDDITTYIDPRKYNQIFAYTAIDAQNFWAQIALDITARRKMSAKLMPNL